MTNPYLPAHDGKGSLPAAPTTLARRIVRILAIIAALACALLALACVFLLGKGALAMFAPQTQYLYLAPHEIGAFQGKMIAGPFALAAFFGRLCWHLSRVGTSKADSSDPKPSLPRRIARTIFQSFRTLFAVFAGAMLLDAVLGAIAIVASDIPTLERKLFVFDETRAFAVWLPLGAAAFWLVLALVAAWLAKLASSGSSAGAR